MIAPARRAAFGALLAHEVKGTDLPAAIATARHVLHDARDQTLLTELVIGTVRMRLALDHQLGLRTSRPLAGLDDEVRTSLRMGAFQLMYWTASPFRGRGRRGVVDAARGQEQRGRDGERGAPSARA